VKGRQPVLVDRAIETERSRRFVDRPRHELEGELDDLFGREVLEALAAGVGVEAGRLGEERVGEP
jgi:hypothetical protein